MSQFNSKNHSIKRSLVSMTSDNSPSSINQFKFNNLSALNKQTLTSYQLIEVEQAFETFDLNNRGYLDPYQFKVAVRALGFAPSKEELKSITNNPKYFDTRIKGINFENFKVLLSKMYSKSTPSYNVQEAFKLFTMNSRNVITFEDLKRVAQEIGEDVPDEELREMIQEFSFTESNGVTLEEFEHIMKYDV
ncbi:EF-hand [Conidiobolus coronatus NRRL 28638]|uniref:EF-hand n=1 Tax=Conidiobolus coronatus (strain ATCC 28846 / CBS 209.66 / NRRL 28638) TaxID=796925 RepID=A0A137PG02_CONC2|nr:EF-hand [Conidiobolus coronatus NRRL 28638]|eukprot:KXN73929.1 EF-hand [Conidiobolus coronatus NRRL 28638]